MSARSEFLRRAATTLLERASKATPGPWTAGRREVDDLHFGPSEFTCLDAPERNLYAVFSLPLADAEYMATLHPPVAAVLAAWLDDAAEHIEAWIKVTNAGFDDPDYIMPDFNIPLAMAAAILREKAPA